MSSHYLQNSHLHRVNKCQDATRALLKCKNTVEWHYLRVGIYFIKNANNKQMHINLSVTKEQEQHTLTYKYVSTKKLTKMLTHNGKRSISVTVQRSNVM